MSLQKQGKIFLQDTEIDADNLVPRLKAISKANNQVRIFVRGDEAMAYGESACLDGQDPVCELSVLRWLPNYLKTNYLWLLHAVL